MRQFGDTVAVSGMNNLGTLLRTAGYDGINALSALKIKTDDPAVQLHLYVTDDGNTPPGVNQVETNTVVAAAGITTNGAGKSVVTAAAMPGSPVTVAVPGLSTVTDTTATIIAVKFRTALAADPVVSAFFTIGGTGADIILTTKYPRANDGTMNFTIEDDTSVGIADDTSSADTTAGDILPTSDGIEILDDVFSLGDGSGVAIDAGLAWVVPESGSLDVEFYAQEAGN